MGKRNGVMQGQFDFGADACPKASGVTILQPNALKEIRSHSFRLPALVRYYDDYEELERSLTTQDNTWTICHSGRKVTLKIYLIDSWFIDILKLYAIFRISINPVTAANYTKIIISDWSIISDLIIESINSPEDGIKYLKTHYHSAWKKARYDSYYTVGKTILYYFCEMEFFGWNASHANIIRATSDPIKSSSLIGVRDGSAILSFDEEAKIVAEFDRCSDLITNGNAEHITTKHLRTISVLLWCFSHAIRPQQIANRDIGHLQHWPAEDGSHVIHLTFRYAKQRGAKKAQEQNRKLKREWSPILVEWIKRRNFDFDHLEFDRPNSLFGLTPSQITQAVTTLTAKLTGIRRTPYEFRHTAAQRKADAGCSRLELAEFLMHSNIDTGKAYIEMSPVQAERINKALGASTLFQAIDRSFKTRSISATEFEKLPDDQQIGAAPHGHFIAGIGGCASGQSFCTKTPALACYECPKFMYLRDSETHEAARASVISIINEFIQSNRAGERSPAYLQLQNVVITIDGIIADLQQSGSDGHAIGS